MSIQSMVMSKPTLAQLFMSRAKESVHENGGRKTAERAVEAAVKHTSAYPSFLIEHGIDPEDALRPERFSELPLTSKKDYIARYPLRDLCLDGNVTGAYAIEKSSGHSGVTTYWPRFAEEDAMVPRHVEFAFRQSHHIDQRSTLVIVTFGLGTWAAGVKLSQVFREIGASGKYGLSVVTPGVNLDEILELVRDLSPMYDQTIMLGYPPFAKLIVDEGVRRGIDWPSLSVRLFLGGEGFSEQWRAHMGERLGHDTSRDLMAISSVFGKTDGVSIPGREHPLSVLIRQLALADSALARELFGDAEVPDLFQYSPSASYIEAVDGQLLFSEKCGVPLVRYAVGDRGGVIPFGRMTSVLEDHGYDVQARLAELGYDPGSLWKLPFFYCRGRADGAIHVGGVNVYLENIASAVAELNDPSVLGFKLATTPAPDGLTERLLVMLEYRAESLTPEERETLAERYRPAVAGTIARQNSEYARLREAAPELAEAVVRVFPTSGGPFAQDVGKIKRKYVV